MLQQLLYSVFYRLVIFVTSVYSVQSAFLENESSSEQCELPGIQMSYFDINNPNLISLDSKEYLNTDVKIPFQYILMQCSASYPVEWVGNIPKHYYFSYILDDEVRSIIRSNSTNGDTQNNMDTFTANKHGTEEFTVRLHIGNETFAKLGFTNISVLCQPVGDNNSDCGKTEVNIMKYDQGLYKNSSMLSVRFSDLALATPVIDVPESEIVKCSNNENFMHVRDPFPNSTTYLQTTEYKLRDFINSSVKSDPTLQLQFLKTNLSTENGTYICAKSNDKSTMPRFDFTTWNESDIVSLSVRNASLNEIYVGENITVTCTSSILLFAKGMRIILLSFYSKDISKTFVKEDDIGANVRERAFGLTGFRNITTNFVVTNETAQEIKCSAPVRRSREWVTKSLKFQPKVPVRVTFQQGRDIALVDGSTGLAYLICNASGDPLPALTWSRLNDEKLPSNQTRLEMGKMFNSSLSWISSKLYFPITPSSAVAEYYGRYFCIARNRFMSLEKPFLFDDKSGQKDSLVFDTKDILSGVKAIWFWIIIASALVMLLGTVAWLGWKLRKQAQNLRLFTRDEIDEFMFGKPEYLLDNSDEYEEMNTYAAYLPYDKHKFEIERDQLEFCAKDIIGSGAYGTVYKGLFKGEDGTVVPVAIKTVNPASEKAYFAALLSEIKIMCYIGKHGNLVELVGSVTKYLDQRQIFVALEYCPNGDLLSYLLKHRETFLNNAGFESNRKNAPKNWVKTPGSKGYCRLAYGRLILSPHLLLVWALQITQGMTYLSSKKVIHGDLAARNILLAGDLKPKIADFGLSNRLQNYSNYVRKGDDLVPWRWLAVECLQFMKFSVKSDVWAFGVLLYELFSLGQVPFGNHTYSELFIVSLCHGERLQRPQFASEKLYGIMLDCWKHFPEDRPSFQCLQDKLKNMCADSEEKMRDSVSRGQQKANIQPEPEHDNSKAPLYMNNLDPIHSEENITSEKTRNGEITASVQNGYVQEVEPSSTRHHSHKSYVNPEQLPSLEMTFATPQPQKFTYVDWDVVH